MLIREYSPRDFGQLTRVWARSSPSETGFETGDLIAWLGEMNPGLCLVGEVRQTIVGGIAATYDGSAGCIHHMAVAPEFQRLGYGRTLLREIEQRLIRMGCRDLHMRVRTHNRSVLPFYFALGYDFEKVISIARTLLPGDASESRSMTPSWRRASLFDRTEAEGTPSEFAGGAPEALKL